jgi:hypothetical protein
MIEEVQNSEAPQPSIITQSVTTSHTFEKYYFQKKNKQRICEICGYEGSDNEYYCHAECDPIQFGRSLSTFWRNLLPTLLYFFSPSVLSDSALTAFSPNHTFLENYQPKKAYLRSRPH